MSILPNLINNEFSAANTALGTNGIDRLLTLLQLVRLGKQSASAGGSGQQKVVGALPH